MILFVNFAIDSKTIELSFRDLFFSNIIYPSQIIYITGTDDEVDPTTKPTTMKPPTKPTTDSPKPSTARPTMPPPVTSPPGELLINSILIESVQN